MNAIAGDNDIGAHIGQSRAATALHKVNKGALRVLGDADAAVVCVNPVGTQAAHRRIKQNTVQLAPVDADLGQGVPGVPPPGLTVDVLPETVEKHALQVFNACRLNLGLQAQRSQLAHGVRQQRDAHTKLPDLWHSFIHVTQQPALLQCQRKAESGYAATDHRDAASSNHSRYSAVMPLRRMTSPQRG